MRAHYSVFRSHGIGKSQQTFDSTRFPSRQTNPFGLKSLYAPVAQLEEALASEARGEGSIPSRRIFSKRDQDSRIRLSSSIAR